MIKLTYKNWLSNIMPFIDCHSHSFIDSQFYRYQFMAQILSPLSSASFEYNKHAMLFVSCVHVPTLKIVNGTICITEVLTLFVHTLRYASLNLSLCLYYRWICYIPVKAALYGELNFIIFYGGEQGLYMILVFMFAFLTHRASAGT